MMYNKEYIDKLKNIYPKGTRIKLIKMKDIQAPPSGTEGTVRGVDDSGKILMSWDNGSSLGLYPEEDLFLII